MSAQPEQLFGAAANDADAQETREWIDALSAVIAAEGRERGHFLIEQLLEQARQEGIDLPVLGHHRLHQHHRAAGRGTLPRQPRDRGAPARLHALERDGDGGQGQPAASRRRRRPRRPHQLVRLAGHHVRRRLQPLLARRERNHGGDCLYIQGHSSPGIYARAFLEGRITEEQLLNFRQEVDGKGLSSYPHPKLMPEFWQFPTVSMGLGPLMAIYQARFLKYLHARGIANTENRKVWAFLGDGEMDEVESLGAIGVAARESSTT
jgi:pyruvate dehydrogenase E1 component